MSEVTLITDLVLDRFDALVIESRTVAAITFVADWCRPSRLQVPIMEMLHRDFADKAVIRVVDVDQQVGLADRFQVRTLPTTVLFADGEIVEALLGFQQDDFLRSYLDHLLTITAKAPPAPEPPEQDL